MTERAPCCESCGAPEPVDELRPVHRVYLETDGEGRVTGEVVLPDVERWCVPCRTLYPNRPAQGSGHPGTGGGPGRTEAVGTEGPDQEA